nr:MAG TPA: hypothetical protein [Caudoviricetes sp.]
MLRQLICEILTQLLLVAVRYQILLIILIKKLILVAEFGVKIELIK